MVIVPQAISGDGLKDFCHTGGKWGNTFSWTELIFDKEPKILDIDSIFQPVTHLCLQISKFVVDGLKVLVYKN